MAELAEDTQSAADLLAIGDRVLARARAGESVEVFAVRGSSTSVRAYDGGVESLSSAASSGVGIRVVLGDRQGFAHCGSLDEAVVAETLAEARDNAGFAEPDPWAGLAEPDGVTPVITDLWSDELVAFSTEHKIDLALELERATTSADARVRSVRTAVYADSTSDAALVSTNGIRVADRQAVCHLSVLAMATDGDETRVGGGVDVARDPGRLSVAKASQEAVERATRLLGAAPTPSGRLTIVLEPRLATTLVGILAGTLTGERVAKGRSPFADRVGEQVASPLLSLVDDPTDARSLGAEIYDGEGLACRRTPLVSEGVLDGFLHNTWTARRLGTSSTGSAIRGYRSTPGVGAHALVMVPGERAHDELVAGVSHGLLVQSLTGLHSGVNPVSGDISVGADGVMIRDGELAEPVCEVTLASSLQRLLADIVAVGADLEFQPGGTGAVSIVIDDVMLSGR